MKQVKPLVLFLAILAMGMTTLVSFMSFLPATNVLPDDHPLVHIGDGTKDGRKAPSDAKARLGDPAVTNRESSLAMAVPVKPKPKAGHPLYFMVFSTSCSPFQNWQAMAFFHFAKKVKQPGNVTRLVSGCTTKQVAALEKVHAEKIAPLDPGFQMHITPDFGVKGDQKYWNKPNGLLDWMENELGFPDRAVEYNDAIIIIVDPDMMLLRPITHKFSKFKTEWVGEVKSDKVDHGIPIAQQYAYGNKWLTSLQGNVSYVVGPDSPIHNLSLHDADVYYPAGPPYLATGRDMYAIAKHWVKFLPLVHDIFPEFMAEMHAYSTAAAHLNLPHQLASGFMVSDVSGDSPKEGFAFLQNVTRADACSPHISEEDLPLVLHYCQRYALGRWFFSKYKLREDFFDCKSPLLREPPLNVAEIYDWNIFPNGIEGEDFATRNRSHKTVLHAWVLCTLLFSLNAVAIDIKSKHCGDEANFNKTWHFHKEDLFQAMLDDPTNPYQRDGLTDKPG